MLGTLPAMSTLIAAVVARAADAARLGGRRARNGRRAVRHVRAGPGPAVAPHARRRCAGAGRRRPRSRIHPAQPAAGRTVAATGAVHRDVRPRLRARPRAAAFEWHAVATGWTVDAVSAIALRAGADRARLPSWYAGSARTSGTEVARSRRSRRSRPCCSRSRCSANAQRHAYRGIALVVAGMVVGATRRREPRAEARNTHPANPDRPSCPAPAAQTATD